LNDYTRIYEDAGAFLEGGDQHILLSASAAADACERECAAGFCILGVEGGQWLNPGMMARLDSIWCVRQAPSSRQDAQQWNCRAADFVREQAGKSPDPKLPPADVFILPARRVEF
jgi:hypothetical protein